jgi:hypothetical protein
MSIASGPIARYSIASGDVFVLTPGASLNGTESGQDAFEGYAQNIVTGALATTETGQDAFEGYAQNIVAIAVLTVTDEPDFSRDTHRTL